MQYVSRKHIWALIIITLILGVLLLLGERLSQGSFISNRNMIAPPSQAAVGERQFMYDEDTVQQQQIKIPQVTIKSSTSKITYTEALKLYGNSVLQFNDSCQMSSKGRSFHLGNEVMIDNRSPRPRTITVGSVSIVVGPYDYGFIILKEKGTSLSVSCSEQSNVAQLVVQ